MMHDSSHRQAVWRRKTQEQGVRPETKGDVDESGQKD